MTQQLQARPLQRANTLERHTGFDLLRNISMLMIIVLHYLSKGGVLYGVPPFSVRWFGAWSIEAMCVCGVNCYVIISAYFLSTSHSGVRPAKVIKLLASMCFYSWLVAAALAVSGIYTFTYKDIILSAIPFLSKEYWFMDVYILMYLLHPYFNRLLGKLERREHRRLVVILLLFFCVGTTLLPKDWTLSSSGGYNIIWFSTLYVLTAYLKKYEITLSKPKAVALFLAGVLLCVGSIAVLQYIYQKTGRGVSYLLQFYRFDRIPVLMSTLGCFFFFQKVKITPKPLAKFNSLCAGATLGVYLWHEQVILRRGLWTHLLHVDKYMLTKWLPLHFVCAVLAVFVVGIIADLLREQLFALAEKPIRKLWASRKRVKS